jgi:glycosyltransferase involved in cell wall biosynthesis
MTMDPGLEVDDLVAQPDPRCRTSLVVTFPHVDHDPLDIFPGAFGGDRETVAYLAWEQRHCPPRWAPRFAPFDRLFALSRFAADAIAEGFGRPCDALPCVVEVDASAPPPVRSEHGLPEDAFVVGMVLEASSSLERKNPLGAVRAIARAYAGDPRVVVVLKIGGAFGPYDGGRVREAVDLLTAAGLEYRLVTETLDRPRLEALYRCMDVYVSLHRAEGFGYTLAEAMALGVPVVATGYSANMEYMTPENSYPVAFAEVAIERPEGPFGRGSVWAEPDVEDAAEKLRHVLHHRDEAAARAARGQADVERLLSPSAVGRRLSELLA